MAITNYINGKQVFPQGKQKRYLLDLLKNKEKSKVIPSNWNGYGYSDFKREYTLTKKELSEYNELGGESKPKKVVSEEDKINVWAKRLAKLSSISVEEAKEIALQKIEYKWQKIDEIQARQDDKFSSKREVLVRMMRRENPLRRIENEEHALAIISASNRHNQTNYDNLLAEAHELEKLGEIEKGTAKEFARNNMKPY